MVLSWILFLHLLLKYSTWLHTGVSMYELLPDSFSLSLSDPPDPESYDMTCRIKGLVGVNCYLKSGC